MTTTGPGIAGTSPGDTADWVYGTKKKRRPLSRSYIEINGKFKKQVRQVQIKFDIPRNVVYHSTIYYTLLYKIIEENLNACKN